MKKIEAPKIRQFNDFRAFLSAFAEFKKKSSSGWSYGTWSRALGLKATSSLTKVIQGDREPGPELIQALSKYFEFDERDSQYFLDLVRLSKLRNDPELVAMVLSRLGRETAQQDIRILEDAPFRFVANWFCLPIRELIQTIDFNEDPDALAKRFRFPLNPQDARRAIRAMLDLGLIGRDPQGKLRLAQSHVDTPNDVGSEGLMRYHEQWLDRAKSAVRDAGAAEREYAGECFLMKREDLPRAKKLIREFRRNFVGMLEDVKDGDEVYQVQMQFFPVTKK